MPQKEICVVFILALSLYPLFSTRILHHMAVYILTISLLLCID